MGATLSAQTFTTLVSFNQGQGISYLVQGVDGNFYTQQGPLGTFDRLTPEGELTIVLTSDVWPIGLSSNGEFYGSFSGSFMEITAEGQMSTTNDCMPPSCYLTGLVQDPDGSFYGTTGAAAGYQDGFVKISPTGSMTTIVSFDPANCPAYPSELVEGTDGDFYGTTSCGVVNGRTAGTVTKVSRSGVMTVVHTFKGRDGLDPYEGLAEGTDGNFYGTTYLGGADGDACGGQGCGTIFKITPSGELTTIYSFCNSYDCTDGSLPSTLPALLLGSDGNFYGMTQCGGPALNGGPACGYGTIFKITPKGELTTVHIFDGSDGTGLYGSIVQGTDGNFYGTTFWGGAYQTPDGPAAGTAFRLSLGLPPFVKTLPTSGAPGATVMILGNNLTNTSSVSFGNTEAAFTVVSDTEILATVPKQPILPGAYVEVTTPNGVLQSNLPFRVTITGWVN